MVKAVKIYTALCLIFVVLLGLSGSFTPIINNIVYAAAFLIPVAVGLIAHRTLKREREEVAGVFEKEKYYIGMKSNNIIDFILIIMPTILLIFAVAYLTNLLFNLMGVENSKVPIQPLFEMLLIHAILPTVLEESLFRYIPLKILSPYSKRATIIISALYFALIHCNLFQLPYAFIAGIILITVDIMYDSIVPSLIIHLMNNTMSVLFIKYGDNADFTMYFMIILCTLAALSIIGIIFRRKSFKESIDNAILCEKKVENVGYYPFLIAVPTLLMAFLTLFMKE